MEVGGSRGRGTMGRFGESYRRKPSMRKGRKLHLRRPLIYTEGTRRAIHLSIETEVPGVHARSHLRFCGSGSSIASDVLEMVCIPLHTTAHTVRGTGLDWTVADCNSGIDGKDPLLCIHHQQLKSQDPGGSWTPSALLDDYWYPRWGPLGRAARMVIRGPIACGQVPSTRGVLF